MNMRFHKFINNNKYVVQLVGPNREIVIIDSNKETILSEYYLKYCPKYLKIIDNRPLDINGNVQNTNVKNNSNIHCRFDVPRKIDKRQSKPKLKMLGAKVANTEFWKLINSSSFTNSNNIGVGILSYNRKASIARLLDSIERYTDLSKVVVFVSDESDNVEVKNFLRSKPWITLIDNDKRLGVAGNSNRLLRCLNRFKYKLLLNDDVEIIKSGWDNFYFEVMKNTEFHCFCYRQIGVYGATPYDSVTRYYNKYAIKTVNDKPHGAVIAFDDLAFNTVGYFDVGFGLYGMEHVDWVNRISISGIQPPGFHDVMGSDKYFIIHHDCSTSSFDPALFKDAKNKYLKLKNDTNRIYVNSDNESIVPSISYIIPYRSGQLCDGAIEYTINNIRAQSFPSIEIIISELDTTSKININTLAPIFHVFTHNKQEFNKAMAFNIGVMKSSNPMMILHDSDIITQNNYTKIIYDILLKFESCHIGKHVLYLDRNSTAKMISNGVNNSLNCKNVISYFEGGSLGCRKDSYIRIGGFCEKFFGYGNEDCEFYERLCQLTNMLDARSINFIHLDHDHVSGWEDAHSRNKSIHKSLLDMNMELRHKMIYNEFKDKYIV